MKQVFMIMLLTAICSLNLLSQTTYYISSSQGNDLNSGISENAPWKSIEKINNSSFFPGDRILFKRGEKWNSVSLSINNSGTSISNIILGAYGIGEKPILSLNYKIQQTDNPNNWLPYSANIWRCQVSNVDDETVRLFTDDNFTEFGARATSIWTLDNIDNWHYASGYLYIYSMTNPAGDYFTAWANNLIYPYTIRLSNTDFITIQDLAIRGGYQCIYLKYSDNIIFQDCEIGRGTNGYGLVAHYSNFGIVKNCSIDSYWGVKQNHNEEPSTSQSNGITLAGGNYWEIFNNQILNWHHSGISIQGYSRDSLSYKSNYNKVYDNFFTAKDIVYGRAYEVFAEGGQLGYASYNHFYRNMIHKCPTRSQIGGDNNYVYFNVFDSTLVQPNRDNGIADAFRVEGSGYQRVNKKNYIFNNTIYYADGYGIFISDYDHFVANNLVVNAHQYFVSGNVYTPEFNGLLMLNVNYGGSNVIKNNLLYSTQTNTSSNIFYYWGAGKNISQFNQLNGSNNNNILNNRQHVGTKSILINNDFSLPVGSLALNNGIDISELIPLGFIDINGNLIDRTNPDIGAVQSSTNPDITSPRLVSANLSDSAKLILTFSEPISTVGVSNLTNYSVSNGIVVQAVQLGTNQSQLHLNTSTHIYGQNYSVTVTNIRDLAGNFIQSSNNSATYTCSFNPPPPGGLNKLIIFNAVSSDTDDVNLGPDKTIDGLYFTNGGDPFSRWAIMPMPQWLIYDLGVIKQIGRVKIAFYEFQNGRIYTYNIYISNDKNNWTKIVNNALSSSQEWTEISFNNTQARYVKIEPVSNNQNTWATIWEVEIWGSNSTNYVSASAKVFMQGTYSDGQMNSTLNDLSQLPMQQPYNISPWNYNGYESVTTVPLGVVDWVLVELRNDTSAASSVFKRAAFITADGYIVDLDGTSPVVFNGISSSNYYIVLRHRNHLSIMSANKILLSGTSSLYDFTQSKSSAYGNDLAALGNNKYGMYAGDGDANGLVNILDYSSVGNNLFQAGYKMGDLDMNGIINILDYGKTNQNLLKVSKVPGTVIF